MDRSGPQLPKVVFFDWRRPPLTTTAEWLVENVGRFPQQVRPVLVLPTARACQRLQVRFLQLMEDHGLSPFKLELLTIGELPERLYPQEKGLASPLMRNIAWMEALRSLAPERLAVLFPGLNRDQVAALSSLAAQLQALHERLGADIWSFKSVARAVAEFPGFPQQARWEALADLQDHYYRQLEADQIWDPQAARNVAIRRNLCRATKPVVLVGLADLNRGPREMLLQCGRQVTSLVFCSPDDQDGFDELGCLRSDYWAERRVAISDERLRIVDRPADQARLVKEFIEERRRLSPGSDLAVGLPDEEVWPQVERMAERRQWKLFHARGMRLRDGAVVRLLLKLSDYLEGESYPAFAELIRHPDLDRWLSAKLGPRCWSDALDLFQNRVLPAVVPVRQDFPFAAPPKSDEPIQAVVVELRKLLEPLLVVGRPLTEWAAGFRQWLEAVYQERGDEPATDPYDRQIQASVPRLLALFSEIEQSGMAHVQVEQAGDALAICLRFLDEPYLDQPETEDAIPVLGWLDLPLEDVAAVVVTGMNNHVVPTSERSEAFLPNSLCTKLGLLDNHRRFARDVYAMSLLDACHEEVLWIVGRRNARKEPLRISRLLLHADDATLVRRSQAFFDFDRQAARRFSEVAPGPVSRRPLTQQFSIPRPPQLAFSHRLSVTRFRDYLKCPYRFYLTAVLRLEEMSDELREMDGGRFGDLAHDILEDFGRSSARESDQPGVILEFLQDTLATRARPWLSRFQLPSLKLQVENLSFRFETFAEIQAERRREGWLIERVEEKIEWNWMVDGHPFPIVGMIDRIDRHEDGRLAVWDYKTSDSGKTAEQAHRDSSGNWIDLQLPLYRLLIAERFPGTDPDAIGLGYVLLPSNRSRIQFDAAQWNSMELAEADETARQVVRGILASQFWPPNPEPPQFSDATAAICQDLVFERWSSDGDGPVLAQGRNHSS